MPSKADYLAKYLGKPSASDFEESKKKKRRKKKKRNEVKKEPLSNGVESVVNAGQQQQQEKTVLMESDEKVQPESLSSKSIKMEEPESPSPSDRHHLDGDKHPEAELLQKPQQLQPSRDASHSDTGALENISVKRERHDSDSDMDDVPRSRERHDSDSDMDDVPRSRPTTRHDSDSDMDNVPRRGERHDSDSDMDNVPRSRPTRHDSDSDMDELPRRRERHDSDSDMDDVPRQRERHDSDSDEDAVPRAPRHDSPSESKQGSDSDLDELPRRSSKRKRKSPPSKHTPRGLKTASAIDEELARQRDKDLENYRSMDQTGLTGKNAETIYRDSKTGKRITKEEWLQQNMSAKEKRKQEQKERKQTLSQMFWGGGLAQLMNLTSLYQQKEHLTTEERSTAMTFQDPMAQYEADRKKKKRKTSSQHEEQDNQDKEYHPLCKAFKIPFYKGAFPSNRFDIRPGYRWDGIDRSNGFEKSYFDMVARKEAEDRAAYNFRSSTM